MDISFLLKLEYGEGFIIFDCLPVRLVAACQKILDVLVQ